MSFGVKVLVQLLFVVCLVDAQRKRTTERPETERPDIPKTIICKSPNKPEPDPRDKCSQIYYQCDEDRIGTLSPCQNKLWYDVETNECLEYIDVPACNGLSRGPVSTTIALKLTTIDQSIFDCTKLRSANYAVEEGTVIDGKRIPFCSNKWYTCSNGQLADISYCDNGYYFDQSHDRCDTFDAVYDCNGGIKVTLAPTTLTPNHTTEDLHFDCSNKKDGKYPDPLQNCSHTFIYCSNGIASKEPCAANTFYNPETQQCENKDYIFDCTGIRLSSTIQPSTISAGSPHPFNCSGLRDAFYPNPVKACSIVYYECANGLGWYKICSDTLVFDVELQTCNYVKKVSACLERPRPSLTTAGATDLTRRGANGRIRTTTIQSGVSPMSTLMEVASTDSTGLDGRGRRRTTTIPSDATPMSTLMEVASTDSTGLDGRGRRRTTIIPSDATPMSTLMEVASTDSTGLNGRRRTTIIQSEASMSTLTEIARTRPIDADTTPVPNFDTTRREGRGGRVRTTPRI